MYPELVSFLPLRSYGAMLLTGFVVGFAIARWRARRQGVDVSHIENLMLIVVALGVIGARVFYVAFYQKPEGLWDVFKVWNGGLVFFGGLVFAAAGAVTYIVVRRLSLGEIADIIASGLAIGLAFGRIGCFLNGCCWGDVCAPPSTLAGLNDPTEIYQMQSIPEISGGRFPLAVRFPRHSFAHTQHVFYGLSDEYDKSLPVHPVQLYGTVLCLALCGLLNVGYRYRRREGDVFLGFGVGYAAIRFWLEILRADNVLHYLGMTLSQMIAVVLAVTCVVIFVCRRIGCLRGQGRDD